MTELRMRIMGLCIEEFENVFSRGISGNLEGGRPYGTLELGGVDESGANSVKNPAQPCETRNLEKPLTSVKTNNPALTATSLATRATRPTQLETWVRKFEQHERIAYLMAREQFPALGFSPGDRNPSVQTWCGETRQDSNELGVKDGSEHTLCSGQHLQRSVYPKFLNGIHLAEAHLRVESLGEDDVAPTIQSQQTHPLREIMRQREENAEDTIRATHSQHRDAIDSQTDNIILRPRLEDRRY